MTPPWQLVTPDGVIGLGDGAAAVCAVSTVNFALRSPAEQEALTAAYGRWLHSLTGPVQILIRTGHADLASAISRLRQDAPALPDPALEQAALAHAGFLAGLGATRQVLTRQVLLVTREAGRAAPGRPGSAAGRAAQRTAEAARLLASADLQARPLDGAQVTALLAAACDPGGPHRAQRLAPPGPLTRRGHGGRTAPLPGGMPGAGQDGLPAPPALQVAARHVEIDGDCAADAGRHRVPGRGRARVAGTADLLPRPARHRAAHRAGPARGRRGPAAAAARQAGVLPPDLGRAGPSG